MRPRRALAPLIAAAALASASASPGAAQKSDDGPPPGRAPADARFGGGPVTLGVSGLNLPQGFGVPTVAAGTLRAGSAAIAGAESGPLPLAAIATAPPDPDSAPPDRPPPDARFQVGTGVNLAVVGLNLPTGFGVGATGGPVPIRDRPVAGLPAGGLAAGRVAAIRDAASDDPGPPAALPPDARLGTGNTVSFAEAGVSLSTANVSLGTVAATTGVAGADLGGFAVREEAGGYRFTLGADVLFDFDKSTLRPEAGPILTRLVAQVREQLAAGARYQVEGHTDAKGSDAYNERLSDRRARSVKDWLARDGGVASRLVRTVGYGERRPVAPNQHPDGRDDPEGRQKNRRVEILVTPSG